MTTTLNAATAGAGGLISTADASGVLQLQTAGTAALTIDGSQNVTVAGNITLNNGAADGAQVTLSSSGYSDWNIDNYSGSFRLYNGATERLRLDTSGNLGLGVTPSAWASNFVVSQIGRSSYLAGRTDAEALYLGVNNYWNGTNDKYIQTGYASYYSQGGGAHNWYRAASGTAGTNITFTNSMTLDASGNLGVGTTSPSTGIQAGTNIAIRAQNGDVCVDHANGTASGTGYIYFGYSAGIIGSITQNGTTGVLYNLTSDYRLKNDPQPLTGAKEFVMALQPKKWQWWDGSGEGVGFIAHEFMEVAKHSGNGEKDAVDENGNPVYQSIQPSSSEVMANLVALLQEQQALITQLTERITALENK